MAEDYYATLGVTRSASAEEISKAYRQLARKHHPDLNPDDPKAKERFQRIQTAFDVLNDPKRRETYDRYGTTFEQGAPGGGPGGWPGGRGPGGVKFDVDMEDLFAGGTGEGGPSLGGSFADLFRQFGQRGKGRRHAAAGAHLEHDLQVPFATAVLGGEAQIAVRRADGREETIRVKIPLGIEDGKRIRVRGQGDPGVGGAPAGDILIRIHVAPHPYFRRTGKRLDVTLPITLGEALSGAKIDLPTPHGTITLTVPPGSSSGAKLRVKGHGVRGPGEPGDLFAELEVMLPPDLTEADRRDLAAIACRYHDNPRGGLAW